jgi:uroporphyrinogen-III synthase
LEQLSVEVGVAALVGGEQVALFRLDAQEIRAIGNLDPYSKANVLSRGIVGSRSDAVFVASPMYKQPFDLRTGQCLDDPAVSVPTFDVRVVDGVVQVLVPPQLETERTRTENTETTKRETEKGDATQKRERTRSRDAQVLAGYRIGITSTRRADELATLLERQGAVVESAPALMTLSCSEDVQLRDATVACIEQPPDLLIANTGVGMRGWFEAAAKWGLGAKLVAALQDCEILARGPKAVGAVRAAGLQESWVSESDSLDEILAYLRERDLTGTRMVMQEHGTSTSAVTAALERQGSEVTVVTVYRCLPAADQAPLFRLVDLVADRDLDAVVFTAAPAVKVLLDVAAASGRKREVVDALRGHVIAACVGPVTAEAFAQWGIPVIQPARSRLAALAREIAAQLPARRHGVRIDVGGRQLLMGRAEVVLDGVAVRLTPAPYAVLQALAREPGRIVSRQGLLSELPSGYAASEHAVEAAVARLRTALGADLVRTVVKRGYRLAVESPT